MTWTGSHLALAGRRTVSALGEGAVGKLSLGWQDKSAASGRAHVVGLFGYFGQFLDRRCWRFWHNPQRFQRFERHRRLVKHAQR